MLATLQTLGDQFLSFEDLIRRIASAANVNLDDVPREQFLEVLTRLDELGLIDTSQDRATSR